EYKVVSDLKDTVHTLLVCKATESQNGYIDLTGIECEEILPSKNFCDKRIEFIGNSITCGMGLEMNEIPCDSGMWFDQHNAYFAYGPVISRKLGADWLLSSVSGIGTTRNWNSKRPTMPQVYDNLFLDTDSTLLWNKEIFKPDLVSICLGTNDFSDGDGTYDREPLDSAMYVNDYIQFLKHIRNKNSSATICCLTSPTLSGKKSTRLQSYLKEIVKKAKEDGDDKIHLYAFQRAYNNGCTGHPDRKEHEMIADELLPFYRKIMNWQ
ncbi:MAG: hypothetical protein JW995_02000, partial [Melioribacteraceae bacterium]|nr:hypothetical protein [Melioribacteraceae bacterium]